MERRGIEIQDEVHKMNLTRGEKNIRMTLVCTFFSGIKNSTLLDMIVSRSNPQLNSKSAQPILFHSF